MKTQIEMTLIKATRREAKPNTFLLFITNVAGVLTTKDIIYDRAVALDQSVHSLPRKMATTALRSNHSTSLMFLFLHAFTVSHSQQPSVK